jgi:hypothetical protein
MILHTGLLSLVMNGAVNGAQLNKDVAIDVFEFIKQKLPTYQ